ncbi:uncharacterized protein LOC144751887 [Ciona intestinalis]
MELLRNLCSVTFFIAALCVVSYGKQQQCSNTNPCSNFNGGEPFIEPEVLESDNGHLFVHLKVEMTEIYVDWLKLYRRTFNKKLAAPTWVVNPGDTVHLRVSNLLGPNSANQTGHNTMHKPNTTNIHVHGLHISPKGISDNVFIEIEPGQTQEYLFNIHSEHPAGTYWYHPHFHGSGAFQVTSGMAGLIVIKDRAWDLPRSLRQCSCPRRCQHDINMLVQPTLQYSTDSIPVIYGEMQAEIGDDPLFRNDQYIIPSGQTLSQWLLNATNGVNYFTVNGQLHPTLTFRAGRMKRMRFANAGGSHSLELEVTTSSGHPCEWREIALDGVYLEKPRIPRANQTLIVPGGRADWMIKCEYPGTYQIRSIVKSANNPSMGNFDRFNGLIATIKVVNPYSSRWWDFPSYLPARPQFLPNLINVDENNVEKFIYEIGPGNTLNRELFPESGNLIRHKMRLGSIQEWTFVNAQPSFLHPMHVHVNHFQVIRYNKYTGPIVWTDRQAGQTFVRLVDQSGKNCEYQWERYQSGQQPSHNVQLPPSINATLGHEIRYQGNHGILGYAEVGDYRETIPVPALSNITIRFIPSIFTGVVVTHCHNSVHTDHGMMMLAEIVGEDASIDGARVSVNGSFAGTCHPGDWYPGMPSLPTMTHTTTAKPINFILFVNYMLAYHYTDLAEYFLRPEYYHNLYIEWRKHQHY